ncbi:rod shape-determining protein MreC [Verrucomicrobium sp. GAS474]|uniref:rod shape-determining protein MreC n=1 Tax=Verrucomicrobium sp. GAS474 TaxID=1882831 RepID=UPI00087D8646|nr:rod shape-determining protein MreC [Verrucomicrobium sp. GAS474]SDU24425.1 rod shape-determining protein MreC [Verrucomicrobium sp. GAS474]
MNRLVWYTVSILALALVMGGLFMEPDSKQQIQKVVLDLVSPAISLFDHQRDVAREVRHSFKSLDQVQKEAAELREKNIQLTTENAVLKNFQEENAKLREMLEFKQATRYKLMAARVVSHDPANWWDTVQINRGWTDSDKLVSDLPVVTPRGLVGKTKLVSRNVTEVILINNQNCRVSGVVEGSRDQGIVIGMGAPAEGSPRLRMKFLPRGAQLAVGQRIFTGGAGGVFPPGLFIGTIMEAPPLSASTEFGLYREAVLDPALDLTDLDELFVVLSE